MRICIFFMPDEFKEPWTSFPPLRQAGGVIGRVREQRLPFMAVARSEGLLPWCVRQPPGQTKPSSVRRLYSGRAPHTDTVTGRLRLRLPCTHTDTKMHKQSDAWRCEVRERLVEERPYSISRINKHTHTI